MVELGTKEKSTLLPPASNRRRKNSWDSSVDDSAGLSTVMARSEVSQKTTKAGNLYFSSNSLLLSSLVSLSVLTTPEGYEVAEQLNNGGGSNKKITTTPNNTTKILRDSVHRHVQFHLYRTENRNSSPSQDHVSSCSGNTVPMDDLILDSGGGDAGEESGGAWPSSSGVDSSAGGSPNSPNQQGYKDKSESKRKTNSMIATDHLRSGNVNEAIAVYEAALRNQLAEEEKMKQEAQQHLRKWKAVVDVTQQADTHSKLATLCLYAGRLDEALDHAKKSFDLLCQEGSGDDRLLPLAMANLQVGLTQVAAQRKKKALKSWREAIVSVSNAVGYYDHPVVAILLNNIGVLHYETRNILAGKRALEESLTLQKQLLKTGGTEGPHRVDLDYCIFQLANTMGNLSIVLEHEEDYAQSLGLLQDAESLYDSVIDSKTAPPPLQTRLILQPHTDRILQLHQKAGGDRRSGRRKKHQHGSSNESNSLSATDTKWQEEERCDNCGLVEELGDEETTSLSTSSSSASFGDMLNIPPPIINNPIIPFEEADLYDYLLLGQVTREWTPRERVRETVLASVGQPTTWRKSRPGIADLLASCGMKRVMALAPIPGQDASSLTWHNEHDEFEQHVEQVMIELVGNGEIDQAIAVLHNVFSKYRNSNNTNGAGTTLFKIGKLHLLNEEYLRAYALFQETCTIQSHIYNKQHPMMIRCQLKLGLLRYAALDVSAAEKTLRDIRSTYLGLGYGHHHLAQIMNNLGVLRYQEGDMKTAHRMFEIAYEYQRRLLEEDYHKEPNVGKIREHARIALAYTLMNMGFLYHRKADLLGALRLLEEAKLALTPHLSSRAARRVVPILQENIERLIGKGMEINCCGEDIFWPVMPKPKRLLGPDCPTLPSLLWKR